MLKPTAGDSLPVTELAGVKADYLELTSTGVETDNGTLKVTGKGILDTLQVNKTTTLKDTVTAEKTLSVTGALTAKSTLSVTGASTLASVSATTITASGKATLSGGAEVKNDLIVSSGALDVTDTPTSVNKSTVVRYEQIKGDGTDINIYAPRTGGSANQFIGWDAGAGKAKWMTVPYSSLSGSPSDPQLTLNGALKDVNSELSFYAPTSVGSNGQFLCSSGSGAPSFKTISTYTISNMGTSITAYSSSGSNLTFYAPTTRGGTAGQVWTSNGSNSNPSWKTIETGSNFKDVAKDTTTTAYKYFLGSNGESSDTPKWTTHLGSELSASSFNATSDIRKKNIIKKFTLNNKHLSDLDVYRYTLRDDSDKIEYIGLIAQEVEKIYPELITEDEDGYLSIKESKLVYILLEEVKELRDRVGALEGKGGLNV